MKHEVKAFAEIVESLYTYNRLLRTYHHTPRYYGIDDLLYDRDVHIVKMIGDNEGSNLNDLATMSYRKNSTMSELIKKLSKIGLVNRIRDSKDNRQYKIYLTEKGKKVYKFHENLDYKNYERNIKIIREKMLITIDDMKKFKQFVDEYNIILDKLYNKNN